MNGKTHVALGLAAAVALGHSPLTAPLAVTLALAAGSLLPDLDHRNGAAPLKKPLPPLFRWFAAFPAKVFTHRGPLHSLFVFPLVLLALELLSYIPAPYGQMLALGAAVHLLADALTKSGVPLFWPLTKRRFGIPIFTTGGRFERAIIPALFALWLWLGE